MKIQTISASYSRKVPHPGIDFASLTSYASISATLEDGDLAALEAEKLQLLCDAIVDTHIDSLVYRHHPKRRDERVFKMRAEKATADAAANLAKKHKGVQ